MLKVTNPALLTTLQYKLSMLYYQELVLVGDFQALVWTCLCVIVLSVSPSVNGTPPGSKDRRNYTLCKKIRKTTLKTGRLG